MSLNENEVWLEAAKENVQQALDEGNFELARAVIGDVRDRGYTNAADTWARLVVDAEAEKDE